MKKKTAKKTKAKKSIKKAVKTVSKPKARLQITDVESYLASIPEKERAALKKLRHLIKSAAPKAAETYSYRIPLYRYKGPLVGFSASAAYCGFHIMSPSLLRSMKKNLKKFTTTAATIHFTPDKQIPSSLVKKIVKARIKANEARMKKMKGK